MDEVEPRGHVERVPCDMQADEFNQNFVRKGLPAIIEGCNYQWLTANGRHDLSVHSVLKVLISQLCLLNHYPLTTAWFSQGPFFVDLMSDQYVYRVGNQIVENFFFSIWCFSGQF